MTSYSNKKAKTYNPIDDSGLFRRVNRFYLTGTIIFQSDTRLTLACDNNETTVVLTKKIYKNISGMKVYISGHFYDNNLIVLKIRAFEPETGTEVFSEDYKFFKKLKNAKTFPIPE